MRQVIIIPARYNSTRLPGKPLINLLGRTVIQRTYEQCSKVFPSEDIYVATDDERIFTHCENLGINVLMTPVDCLTGTDRVAFVSEKIKADTYINVQGDEPLMNPEDIKQIADEALKHPNEIINGYTEILSEEQFRSTSIPKVVFRPDGRLLYMSRSAIPTDKKNRFIRSWRQVCVYAFPPDALKSFSNIKEKTNLEEIEDIEIIRFLELGYEIRMVRLSGDSVSVDTPEDVEIVKSIIQSRGE